MKYNWENFGQRAHLPALKQLTFRKGREEDQRTSFVATRQTHHDGNIFSLSPECRASREVTKRRFLSLTGGDATFDVSRWTWWKRSRIGEYTLKGVVVREMSKVAAAMYQPRGLGRYRRRRLLWLSQSDSETSVLCRPFRRLPLSRCTVQNGILYVRGERAAIIRWKCIWDCGSRGGCSTHWYFFILRSPYPYSAPSQPF